MCHNRIRNQKMRNIRREMQKQVPMTISYFTWRLLCTYGRDVLGYCQLRLTGRCRHPAPGQDLIPLQRLHVFAHSRDPHPAIKLWCQVSFTKSKTIFQIEMYCMQCFLKSKYIKVELSMIKIGELLRKLWSLRNCFLILPPGALAPQGVKCAVKRDVSKHWCTLQWCASRGWVIAHENWTSWCLWWLRSSFFLVTMRSYRRSILIKSVKGSRLRAFVKKTTWNL